MHSGECVEGREEGAGYIESVCTNVCTHTHINTQSWTTARACTHTHTHTKLDHSVQVQKPTKAKTASGHKAVCAGSGLEFP